MILLSSILSYSCWPPSNFNFVLFCWFLFVSVISNNEFSFFNFLILYYLHHLRLNFHVVFSGIITQYRVLNSPGMSYSSSVTQKSGFFV